MANFLDLIPWSSGDNMMRAHHTPDRFVIANSFPPLPPPEVVVFRRFPQLLSRCQIMLDSTSNNIGILMMLCEHIDYVSDYLKCCSLLKDGSDSLRNQSLRMVGRN